MSDLVSSPVRTEKTRDIRLARVEASDTHPAGGVCVGDNCSIVMFYSALAASNRENMSRSRGQIRQYRDRRVIVVMEV